MALYRPYTRSKEKKRLSKEESEFVEEMLDRGLDDLKDPNVVHMALLLFINIDKLSINNQFQKHRIWL